MKKTRELVGIAQALYQKEYAGFQKILSREAALRAQFEAVNRQLLQERNPVGISGGVQNLGVDLLWRKWMHRSKAQINAELAQVLAQKEHNITQLRRAFGKKHAAESILAQQHAKHITQTELMETESLVEWISQQGLNCSIQDRDHES